MVKRITLLRLNDNRTGIVILKDSTFYYMPQSFTAQNQSKNALLKSKVKNAALHSIPNIMFLAPFISSDSLVNVSSYSLFVVFLLI